MLALAIVALQSPVAVSTVRPMDGDSAAPYSIGTRLLWEVTVDDPLREGAAASETPADLGLGWEILSKARDDERGGVDFRRTLELMPLEGGSLELPGLEVSFGDGSVLQVEPITVEVQTELGPDEDAPRAAPGFRDVQKRDGLGDPRIALLVLIGLVALPLILLGLARRPRRRTTDGVDRAPSPVETLRSLDPALEPRRAISAIAPTLRRASELACGESRGAATDQEWVAWWRAEGTRVDEGLRGDVALLVEEAGELRFRGQTPTSFAAKDLHGRALAAAEKLGQLGPEDAR